MKKFQIFLGFRFWVKPHNGKNLMAAHLKNIPLQKRNITCANQAQTEKLTVAVKFLPMWPYSCFQRCLCAPNFFGIHCTDRSNDCSSGTNGELCGHGLCVNHDRIGFTCICEQVSFDPNEDGFGRNHLLPKKYGEKCEMAKENWWQKLHFLMSHIQ